MCYTSLHFRDCNIHTISQLFFLRKYFTAEYLKNYNRRKEKGVSGSGLARGAGRPLIAYESFALSS